MREHILKNLLFRLTKNVALPSYFPTKDDCILYLPTKNSYNIQVQYNIQGMIKPRRICASYAESLKNSIHLWFAITWPGIG